MRDTITIKNEMKALQRELDASQAVESHGQLMVLVHDELDECTTVDQLRKFIKDAVVPHVYPVPSEEDET